jgi:hypothetical protein
MVVCAQCVGATLPWVVEHAFPRLAELESACRSVETAAEVIAALDAARGELREAAAGVSGDEAALPEWIDSSRRLDALAGSEAMGKERIGFKRFLYKVGREMNEFMERPGREARVPQHARMPVGAAGDSEEQALAVWAAVMRSLIHPRSPFVVIKPLGGDWVDIVVGEPSTPQFYCLLATPQAIPPASEIPYGLDENDLSQAEATLESWGAGDVDLCSLLSSAGTEGGGRTGIRSWFGNMRKSIFARG